MLSVFRLRPWLLPAVAAVVVLLVGLSQVRRAGRLGGAAARGFFQGRTTINHAVAIERVRAVAKLVTSETTVRDVVIFENTRYGSTKRTLLVVTGRVHAGFDLTPEAADSARGVSVRIDSVRHHVTITLPPPKVISVEVIDIQTYDERAGLLNPFRPADRDAIQRSVRRQLRVAGEQSGSAEHAARSAKALLETLFGADGYTAEVVVRGPPPVIGGG